MGDSESRRESVDAPSTAMGETSIVGPVVPVGHWGERLAK